MKSPEGGDAELPLGRTQTRTREPSRRRCSARAFRSRRSSSTISTRDTTGSESWVSVSTTEPTPVGIVSIAVFADTCGNLIQIYESIEQPPVTDHAETAGQ